MKPYILYGSYASYYTAKTRSYLRKKGIPFIERLPSHPRFRSYVRPTSGSHRIPQLETPEGEVLQDSTTIFDALEARFSAGPAVPPTPRQGLVTHLMELLASEGLVQLAWRYRWAFNDNMRFVKMDCGRSFRPQGSDEELLNYGQIIADRMLSRRALDSSPEALVAMERSFIALLQHLESHFIDYPFMLGGHPSAADYALMGALHAHMGRDPVPLGVMQRHAPRVFRWVEHMNTPEIQSPEFPDCPVAYPDEDAVPDSLLAILGHFVAEDGERFSREALAYNQHMAKWPLDDELPISAQEDQPRLPPVTVSWRGDRTEVEASVHSVWMLQRALGFYYGLTSDERVPCDELLEQCGWGDLPELRIERPPLRRRNRFFVANGHQGGE